VIHTLNWGGYAERMMVIISSAGSDKTTRPWWMNYCYFSLCTLVFMSIPYRLCLFAKTTAKTWKVTKHFSHKDASTFEDDPIYSLKNSSNRKLAAVMAAGPDIRIKREGSGEDGNADEYEEFHIHVFGDEVHEPNLDVPEYWTNQSTSAHFDTKIRGRMDRSSLQLKAT